MFRIRDFGLHVAMVVAAMMTVQTGAFAAASDPVEATNPSPGFDALAPAAADFTLGKELVVHDWVLCVSASTAEQIAKARGEGVAAARTAYADLKAAKSCGQFPELHVILHEPVYQSDAKVDYDARIFAASVNIGGGWPDGFVVYGALPGNR
jgi:hypothetical protein